MPEHNQKPGRTGDDRESSDRNLFDKIAARYARKDIVKSSSICRKYQLMFAIEPVLGTDGRTGVIVDIACGVGAPALYLRGLYDRYIGIDYSAEMIEAARIFNREDSNVQFICSNIKELEIQDIKADMVLAVGALHHMTDLDRVFESLKKLSKPGALFIALEPQRANPIVQSMRWFRGKIDKSYSNEQNYFARGKLHKLLIDNGLRDIEISYQGYFSPPFAQVIMRPQIIFLPLASLAIIMDNLLDRLLPKFLKFISWNIAVRARFP